MSKTDANKLTTSPILKVSVDALLEKERQLLSDLKQIRKDIRQAFIDLRGHKELTIRQQEVLDLVRMGKSNKEISSELNVTGQTVKFHVHSLLAKFDVKSRKEL